MFTARFQKQLTEDRSDFVKAALASCLGRLAATSLRFFEESLAKLREEAHLIPAEAKHEQPFAETVEQFGRTERAALQEAVSRIFVNLSDSSNAVRECLFAPENLSDLCAFFGSSKCKSLTPTGPNLFLFRVQRPTRTC